MSRCTVPAASAARRRREPPAQPGKDPRGARVADVVTTVTASPNPVALGGASRAQMKRGTRALEPVAQRYAVAVTDTIAKLIDPLDHFARGNDALDGPPVLPADGHLDGKGMGAEPRAHERMHLDMSRELQPFASLNAAEQQLGRIGAVSATVRIAVPSA